MDRKPLILSAAIILLLIIISPFASRLPDGLESTALRFGFSKPEPADGAGGKTALLKTFAGTALAAAAAAAAGRILKRRKRI